MARTARRTPENAPATILVDFRPVLGLSPYARNARVHSPDQIEQIAGSIRQFGWTNPILVDSEGIVAGHGRALAASLLYDRGEAISLPDGQPIPLGMVPTIDCSGWPPEKRQAYILADNRLAEVATWDEAILRGELVFLEEAAGFDLGSIGFTDADIARVIAGAEEASAEEIARREWQGMPEFQQGEKTAFRSIPVHFKDQDAVDLFAALIGQKITPNTRFVWYPEIEIETYADKRYASE